MESFSPASAPKPSTSLPPQEIRQALRSRFEFEGLIGRGGMGAVYRCRQLDQNRTVALKLLSGNGLWTKNMALRFRLEACVLSRLDDPSCPRHQNIVQFYEYGMAADCDYFSMELIEGANLRQHIKRNTVSARQLVGFALQICDALEHAHSRGIIHRDIKPENVLVNREGWVKLADFGLAMVMNGSSIRQRLTQTGLRLGTPQYMSPEQNLAPDAVDHRSDIYSLGVLLYECLTGKLPQGRFDPPSALNPEVDSRLDKVILRALENDAEQRYQSVGEMRIHLADVLEGHCVPDNLSPDQKRLMRSRMTKCKQAYLENPGNLKSLEEMKDILLESGNADTAIPLIYELAHIYRQRCMLAKTIITLNQLVGLLSPHQVRNQRLRRRVMEDLACLNPPQPEAMAQRWPDQFGKLAKPRAISTESIRDTVSKYKQLDAKNPGDPYLRKLIQHLQGIRHQLSNEN